MYFIQFFNVCCWGRVLYFVPRKLVTELSEVWYEHRWGISFLFSTLSFSICLKQIVISVVAKKSNKIESYISFAWLFEWRFLFYFFKIHFYSTFHSCNYFSSFVKCKALFIRHDQLPDDIHKSKIWIKLTDRLIVLFLPRKNFISNHTITGKEIFGKILQKTQSTTLTTWARVEYHFILSLYANLKTLNHLTLKGDIYARPDGKKNV